VGSYKITHRTQRCISLFLYYIGCSFNDTILRSHYKTLNDRTIQSKVTDNVVPVTPWRRVGQSLCTFTHF